jgi:hypothetical protein
MERRHEIDKADQKILKNFMMRIGVNPGNAV